MFNINTEFSIHSPFTTTFNASNLLTWQSLSRHLVYTFYFCMKPSLVYFNSSDRFPENMEPFVLFRLPHIFAVSMHWKWFDMASDGFVRTFSSQLDSLWQQEQTKWGSTLFVTSLSISLFLQTIISPSPCSPLFPSNE